MNGSFYEPKYLYGLCHSDDVSNVPDTAPQVKECIVTTFWKTCEQATEQESSG